MTGTHATHVGSLACSICSGRARTCNLWFRGPTPYPLCHRAIWGTVATTTRMQVQLCDLLRFALAAGPHSKRNCNEQWCKRCMRLMKFQVRVWGWVHAGWLALTLAPRPPPGLRSTCGLVAMTSASHAEGRQFDPGQVYFATCSGGAMHFASVVWRLRAGFPSGIIR